MRFAGNLFLACRAVNDLEEGIASEIVGCWVLL